MKKLFFSLMMVCMMVMSSGVVWADGIPINQYYEKPSNFLVYLDSPLREISILLLLFYIVIGFTLVVKKMKKEEKVENEKKSKLEKVFWVISGTLSVVLLLVLKEAGIFLIWPYNRFRWNGFCYG